MVCNSKNKFYGQVCLKIALFVMIVLLLPLAAMAQESANNQSAAPILPAWPGVANNSCLIDLYNGSVVYCSMPPGVFSTVFGPTPSTSLAPNSPNGQVVVKINLKGYRKARFSVHYYGTPKAWTANIGDSATNDGYCGDAATQSNDAEMFIIDTTLDVCGKQGYKSVNPISYMYMARAPHLVTAQTYGNPLTPYGETILLEVANDTLSWGRGAIWNPYLYALAGQPDTEGPVNYDIYAAFNRVIHPKSARVGSGVEWVLIELY